MATFTKKGLISPYKEDKKASEFIVKNINDLISKKGLKGIDFLQAQDMFYLAYLAIETQS